MVKGGVDGVNNMQNQSKQELDVLNSRSGRISFVELMRGIFYLVCSVSIIIGMLMFVYVWQPIWTEGFQDFHSISQSINQLDKTVRPATETIPLMLYEMTEMTDTMRSMHITMLDMHASMQSLEDLNPKIARMGGSLEHMDFAVTEQMEQMTLIMDRILYLVGRMENKLSPDGMMPYNW
jgi:hypothetical protein